MCGTCGCGGEGVSLDGHPISYAPRPRPARLAATPSTQSVAYRALGATHAPGVSPSRVLSIEADILAENGQQAAENRRRLAQQGIFAINLVSSPGSGKTTLLVETLRRWEGRPVAVIEGDQQTSLDADRIRATGAAAVQINTGKGCHLDAHMVEKALHTLEARHALPRGGLLLIENVGNLVCPAGFDLGEHHKVALLSVTEGDDKPLKYPDLFRAADLMVLSKTDLLPYVDFSLETASRYARQINPRIAVQPLSTRTGAGFDDWLLWLQRGCQQAARASE